MALSDILAGQQPASQQQPQAMQSLGLAPTMQPMPDVQAAPPQSPEEVAQRKEGWGQVLQRINSDPNLMRAITVMGLQLMRPGSNLGTAGLAGLSAFEQGKQAEIAQSVAQRKEQREQEVHDVRIGEIKSEQDWAGKKRPLELQKLQAEIAAIPDAARQREMLLKLKEMELQQQPEMLKLQAQLLRAKIGAAARSGTSATAGRETDTQRLVNAMMGDPEIAAIENPAARQAAAYRKAYETMRTLPTQMKLEATMSQVNQEALALYENLSGIEEGELNAILLMMDAKERAMYERGEQLARGRTAPSKQQAAPQSQAVQQTAPQAAPPAKQRRVLTTSEVEEMLSRSQRESSGQIR